MDVELEEVPVEPVLGRVQHVVGLPPHLLHNRAEAPQPRLQPRDVRVLRQDYPVSALNSCQIISRSRNLRPQDLCMCCSRKACVSRQELTSYGT